MNKVDNLTTKERETLEKFRDNLKDALKPELLEDEHYLTRWLRARNYDIKKAEKMLREDIEFRKQMGSDTILEDYTPPEVISKYYSGGWIGHDKEGYGVVVDPLGRLDCKGIVHSAKKSDIFKSKIQTVEVIDRHLKEESKKRGKCIELCSIICDLEGFGMHHLGRPGLDTMLQVLSMYGAHYPENLRYCYIINAPKLAIAAYPLSKPFIHEETRKKFKFLGSDYKEILLRDMDAEILPAHYGGTRCGPDGDPKCSHIICYGGTVPQSYYFEQDDLETENMTEATVNRGSSLQLEYVVKKHGCCIRWEFVSENFDVGFGIFRKTDSGYQRAGKMEAIMPSQRFNSHMVPENGLITCPKLGTYVVRFDNTYSWARSKIVKYSIEVIEPDVLSNSSAESFHSVEGEEPVIWSSCEGERIDNDDES